MLFKLNTQSKKLLADTITPVSVYLRLRDKFPNSLLLESSDYRANDNTFSYICCNPIASIKVEKEHIYQEFPDGKQTLTAIKKDTDVVHILEKFAQSFHTAPSDHKVIDNGLFGYMSYDAVRYFEQIEITKKAGDLQIPDLYYAVYGNIIAINHFNNQAYIFSHSTTGEHNIEEIEQALKVKNFAEYHFNRKGETQSNISDEDYKELVAKCKDALPAR